MKTLVVCFILTALGLAYATPTDRPKNYDDLFNQIFNKYYPAKQTPKMSDEVSSLLQVLDSSATDQDTQDDDGSDEDIATLQGVFNVLALMENERAKAMDDEGARAQLWRGLGRSLWKTGRRYLRRRYCSEELEVKAMLQELVGEEGVPEDDEEEGDGELLANLQTLFSALKKAEAKVMQDDTTGDDKAKVEGWLKRVRRWASRTTRRLTRRYLC